MFHGFNPFAQFAQFDGGDDDDYPPQYEQPQQQGEIDNKELYEILEIPPQSDISLIKGAYKLMAKKHHPDRPGGNPQKFQAVSKAYEVLSDQKLKDLYDKHGKQGLLKNIQKAKQYKKCDPIELNISVTLNEIAVGAYKKSNLKIQKICEDCKGAGGAQSQTCHECKGKQIVERPMQIAPGIVVLQRAPCQTCNGSGRVFDESNACKTCKGAQTVEVSTEVEIPIEKGIPDEHLIKLYGKGTQRQDYADGDVMVQVHVETHNTFIRKGCDLFYQRKISLKEALTGICFEIKQLDDTVFTVVSEENQIIKPNQILTIQGKGLPQFHNELSNGDLHIQFLIEFPESLTKEQKKSLLQILPGPVNEKINGPQVGLGQFNMEQFEQHQEIAVDEQEEGGEQGVECSLF